METENAVSEAVTPVAPKPNKDWRAKSRQKYSLEFKQKVVREYTSGGITAKTLARKYKIASDTAVYNWIRALGGESRRALRAQAKGASKPKPAGASVTVEKTEGRIDLYIKSERAMLLQVIGEQCLEIRRLEAKKSA